MDFSIDDLLSSQLPQSRAPELGNKNAKQKEKAAFKHASAFDDDDLFAGWKPTAMKAGPDFTFDDEPVPKAGKAKLKLDDKMMDFDIEGSLSRFDIGLDDLDFPKGQNPPPVQPKAVQSEVAKEKAHGKASPVRSLSGFSGFSDLREREPASPQAVEVQGPNKEKQGSSPSRNDQDHGGNITIPPAEPMDCDAPPKHGVENIAFVAEAAKPASPASATNQNSFSVASDDHAEGEECQAGEAHASEENEDDRIQLQEHPSESHKDKRDLSSKIDQQPEPVSPSNAGKPQQSPSSQPCDISLANMQADSNPLGKSAAFEKDRPGGTAQLQPKQIDFVAPHDPPATTCTAQASEEAPPSNEDNLLKGSLSDLSANQHANEGHANQKQPACEEEMVDMKEENGEIPGECSEQQHQLAQVTNSEAISAENNAVIPHLNHTSKDMLQETVSNLPETSSSEQNVFREVQSSKVNQGYPRPVDRSNHYKSPPSQLLETDQPHIQTGASDPDKRATPGVLSMDTKLPPGTSSHLSGKKNDPTRPLLQSQGLQKGLSKLAMPSLKATNKPTDSLSALKKLSLSGSQAPQKRKLLQEPISKVSRSEQPNAKLAISKEKPSLVWKAVPKVGAPMVHLSKSTATVINATAALAKLAPSNALQQKATGSSSLTSIPSKSEKSTAHGIRPAVHPPQQKPRRLGSMSQGATADAGTHDRTQQLKKRITAAMSSSTGIDEKMYADLKKKHEEAKDLLVRALVNNNLLRMLDNPMIDEKIYSIQRSIRAMFPSNATGRAMEE